MLADPVALRWRRECECECDVDVDVDAVARARWRCGRAGNGSSTMATSCAAGRPVFFGDLAPLADKRAFHAALAPLRRSDCRVGGDVAIPTPHRPGRAGFPRCPYPKTLSARLPPLPRERFRFYGARGEAMAPL